MAGKACDSCKKPYKGFGATCSECRRAAAAGDDWSACTECGDYFNGRGKCQECLDPDPSGLKKRRDRGRIAPGPSGTSAQGKLRSCDFCKKDINDLAYVHTDNKDFHKECFKCSACQVVMDAMRHTVSPDGKRFCPKCNPASICEVCKGPVLKGATEFKGKRYHPACFICSACGKHLKDRVYSHEGQNRCQDCHENPQRAAQLKGCAAAAPGAPGKAAAAPPAVGTKCAGCREPLKGSVVNFDGKKFHPDCFICAGCDTKLVGNIFPISGRNYCKPCAEKMKKAQDTLECTVCGAAISGMYTPLDVGGQACNDCMPPEKCSGCGEELEGDFKAVKDNKYHLHCFKCSACDTVVDGPFAMRGDDIVCAPCAKKK